MAKLWIKICGITRAEDAAAAVKLGADALGAVFYPGSKRAMTSDKLASVFASVPESVRRIALFVNPQRELVEQVCATGMIDWLQFHGSESVAYCESFDRPYVKAIHMDPDTNAAELANLYQSAEFVLLDKYDKQAPGGTGKTFDWQPLAEMREAFSGRLVLAGGLTPDNVAEAVRIVRPDGVDVSTGVENGPGIKDHERIRQFIEGARSGQD